MKLPRPSRSLAIGIYRILGFCPASATDILPSLRRQNLAVRILSVGAITYPREWYASGSDLATTARLEWRPGYPTDARPKFSATLVSCRGRRVAKSQADVQVDMSRRKAKFWVCPLQLYA